MRGGAKKVVNVVARVGDLSYSRLFVHPGPYARVATLHRLLVAPMPLDRAISTAGGLRFDEVDERLMLKKLPGVFACGEMLDWEAPTGGYLLQACFATGLAAGNGAADWVLGLDAI